MANGTLFTMAWETKACTPFCATRIQFSSLSRRREAHAGSTCPASTSGRMDIIIRSALISGICRRGAKRPYQRVDLPEPLCPASTTASGLQDARCRSSTALTAWSSVFIWPA